MVTDVIAVEKEHLLQVYRRGSVVFDRGRGCRLFDTNGRSYLDLISGVGVASLGHAHPGLAAAIADQAQRLVHTSNLFFHPLQGELAGRLATLSGLPRAFFCNSGAEAVEATLKFARRYWFAQGTPRSGFVAFDRSFHGRTLGAVSVTWDDHYRAPFQPLIPDVTFVAADGGAGGGGGGAGSHQTDSCRHRGADTRRRRRAADQPRDGGCDHGRVPGDRRARH